MTIVFQGHVARVETSCEPRKIDVHVQTAQAECGQVVVLHVSQEAAAHWLVGRAVHFTVYAMASERTGFDTLPDDYEAPR